MFDSLAKSLPSAGDLKLEVFAPQADIDNFSGWLERQRFIVRTLHSGALKGLATSPAFDDESFCTMFTKVIMERNALPDMMEGVDAFVQAWRGWAFDKAKIHMALNFAALWPLIEAMVADASFSSISKVVEPIKKKVTAETCQTLFTWSKNFVEHFRSAVPSDKPLRLSVKRWDRIVAMDFDCTLIAPVFAKLVFDEQEVSVATNNKIFEMPALPKDDADEKEVESANQDYSKWKEEGKLHLEQRADIFAKAATNMEVMNEVISLWTFDARSSAAAAGAGAAAPPVDIKAMLAKFGNTYADAMEQHRAKLTEDFEAYITALGSRVGVHVDHLAELEKLFTDNKHIDIDIQGEAGKDLYNKCVGGNAKVLLEEWKWAFDSLQPSLPKVTNATGQSPFTLAVDPNFERAGQLAASMTLCVTMLRPLRANEGRQALVAKGVKALRFKGKPMCPHASVVASAAQVLGMQPQDLPNWDAFLVAFQKVEAKLVAPAVPAPQPQPEAAPAGAGGPLAKKAKQV